ncbi:MAG TPA: YihY/virulence factor BrkB family protein [Kineosporiaceae bacterium]|nr:YihY/virulence factor BrkB family protein [Kineosporiaceae bacterium]
MSRTNETSDAQKAGRHVDADRLKQKYPGADAEKPTEVPAKGWWQITRRGLKEFSSDNMSLIAAGVAFYAFLALVPTLIAAMLIYGLVTDPAEVQQQVNSFSSALPAEARTLLDQQMTSLAAASKSGLSVGVIISLLLALWSASGGTGNLINAVNTAYDEKETRNFIKKRSLALVLTVAAILFFAIAASLIAVFPAVANAIGLGGFLRAGFEALRWVVLLVVIAIALAVLYRVAPNRDDPKLRWVSVGAVVATVVWIVASLGFSLYVNNFGSYGKTYGSLAGVVVLLLWLWLSVVAVLLGAEVNAEAEKQTVQDTTTGPDKPLGERDAVKADLTPDQPDPDPEQQDAGRR